MTHRESFEIVMSYGGLEGAKRKLDRLCILKWITPEIVNLTEAIRLFKEARGEDGSSNTV